MSTISILYLVIALILSFFVAYFQYYFRVKRVRKINHTLFLLRFAVFFLLCLLLINPQITTQKLINQKPVLSVLIDNSSSISYFQQDTTVQKLIQNIQENSRLNQKFEIDFYSFGDQFQLNETPKFNEAQSNIYESLKEVNKLNKNKVNPVILISDGNQTVGYDYEYSVLNKPLYPIIVGDTTSYEDLSISQLNVNRYSFLNNQFPIEATIIYEGDKTLETTFTIERSGQTVFRKKIRMSPDKKIQTLVTNIKSDQEGLNFYKARVAQISNEKNIINNEKTFSIEVIDKQSQVLILSSIYHPDLGAFKKSIEKDQQRKATIKIIDDKFELSDLQLVVLYQPNNQFKNVLETIQKKKLNYFLVTGTQTDWNFLNSQAIGLRKNSINQTENYLANFNAGYLNFSQQNIGFENLPPLKDLFGETQISIPHQTLLFQNIEGFDTQKSLLATSNENNHKKVFLLGEGIWRWRASTFLKEKSFEAFDTFMGNLVQYASSTKVRDRLDVEVDPLYNVNSLISISAYYVDQNFKFDSRATLILKLINNATNEEKRFPFSLASSSYQVQLESLESGTYDYEVIVEGQNISKQGRFQISNYSAEEQFMNANKDKLERLALKTGTKLYNSEEIEGLSDELLSNSAYRTKQRSVNTKESLINWYGLLFLIAGLLGIEWFVRKYHGKI